jgi:hypothetical protein
MKKNINEQLNIDFKNGTWSTSNGGNNSNGGNLTTTQGKEGSFDASNKPKLVNSFADFDASKEEKFTNSSADFDASEEEKVPVPADFDASKEVKSPTPSINDIKPLNGKKLSDMSAVEIAGLSELQQKIEYEKLNTIEKSIVDKTLGKKISSPSTTTNSTKSNNSKNSFYPNTADDGSDDLTQ